MLPPQLDVRPDVAEARDAGRPVVAVVSAPLTHTVPWPANLQAAQAIQEAVRKTGAVPAVVGVWKGRLTVGLEPAELEGLLRDQTAWRASRRDLAAAMIKGANAGATVSATMTIAARAGLRLVSTAAIGSARPHHGDLTRVWDVSSDLIELSQTPVAVVSSGARSGSRQNYVSEVLDSFRVPVATYRTDNFPTFYMSVGSAPNTVRVDSPAEAARFLAAHWSLGGAGVVLAQPTPADVALSPDELIPALRTVEEQAERDQVGREAFSPFMMDKLNRLTGGKALRAYLGILIANARLAAEVAREMAGQGGE